MTELHKESDGGGREEINSTVQQGVDPNRGPDMKEKEGRKRVSGKKKGRRAVEFVYRFPTDHGDRKNDPRPTA